MPPIIVIVFAVRFSTVAVNMQLWSPIERSESSWFAVNVFMLFPCWLLTFNWLVVVLYAKLCNNATVLLN